MSEKVTFEFKKIISIIYVRIWDKRHVFKCVIVLKNTTQIILLPL